MTMNPRGSLFDRLFGPGTTSFWTQRAAWETQKAAWKAQRHAQRAAWKAANAAQRAAWKAEWRANRLRYRSPFAMVWGLMWAALWVGILALLVLSPEFRANFINFMMEIPKFVVHLLSTLAGRAEI